MKFQFILTLEIPSEHAEKFKAFEQPLKETLIDSVYQFFIEEKIQLTKVSSFYTKE